MPPLFLVLIGVGIVALIFGKEKTDESDRENGRGGGCGNRPREPRPDDSESGRRESGVASPTDSSTPIQEAENELHPDGSPVHPVRTDCVDDNFRHQSGSADSQHRPPERVNDDADHTVIDSLIEKTIQKEMDNAESENHCDGGGSDGGDNPAR